MDVPARIPRWPDETYRRSLIDMHVPDWDPMLLSKFDTADIVKTIAGARLSVDDGLRQLARGPCYWRTKIGQRHRNMKDRDFFGEMVEERKSYGLHAVAYYSVILTTGPMNTIPTGGWCPTMTAFPPTRSATGSPAPIRPTASTRLPACASLPATMTLTGFLSTWCSGPTSAIAPTALNASAGGGRRTAAHRRLG